MATIVERMATEKDVVNPRDKHKNDVCYWKSTWQGSSCIHNSKNWAWMFWGNVSRVDQNGRVVKAWPRHAGGHQEEGGDKGFCVAYKQGGKYIQS